MGVLSFSLLTFPRCGSVTSLGPGWPPWKRREACGAIQKSLPRGSCPRTSAARTGENPGGSPGQVRGRLLQSLGGTGLGWQQGRRGGGTRAPQGRAASGPHVPHRAPPPPGATVPASGAGARWCRLVWSGARQTGLPPPPSPTPLHPRIPAPRCSGGAAFCLVPAGTATERGVPWPGGGPEAVPALSYLRPDHCFESFREASGKQRIFAAGRPRERTENMSQFKTVNLTCRAVLLCPLRVHLRVRGAGSSLASPGGGRLGAGSQARGQGRRRGRGAGRQVVPPPWGRGREPESAGVTPLLWLPACGSGLPSGAAASTQAQNSRFSMWRL